MMKEEQQEQKDTDFLHAILQGLKEVAEGRVVSLEAVKARLELAN